MRLRFLGKDPDSEKSDCPSLYDTDRGTHLVQGWKVDADQAARLHLSPEETCVRVPWRLMCRLANSQIDPDGAKAPRVVPVDAETFLVIGRRVVDSEAWAQMRVPGHEDVVEVPAGFQNVQRDDHGVADH